jgi:hypothetical protein
MLAGAGVPLIEDDIYGELPFANERPKACKAFDRDGRVLLCSSFSKTLAPGYRVGDQHRARTAVLGKRAVLELHAAELRRAGVRPRARRAEAPRKDAAALTGRR